MLLFLFLFAIQDTQHNGSQPQKPLPLKIAEELTLGADEDDDNQQFTPGVRVTADKTGAMYILDPGNYQVAVFDAKGKFVRKFGQKGQGPGEFQQAKEIVFDQEGRLAVFDVLPRKIHFFDKEGKFLAEKSFPQPLVSLSQPGFLKNGNILLSVVRLGAQGEQYYEEILYDKDFNTLKTFLSMEQPKKDWSKMQEPGFWASFLQEVFEGVENGVPLGVLTGDDSLLVVRSNLYQGTFYDLNGGAKFHFDKKHKPRPYTEDARRVFYEKIWQSLCNNPFLANALTQGVFEKAYSDAAQASTIAPITLLTTLGDKVLFLTNYDISDQTGVIEVFDKTGRFIAATPWTGSTEFMVGAGEKLYMVGENEDGVPVVTRYGVSGLGDAEKVSGH